MFNPVALASFALLASFTPGPNNIMALTNASKYGLKTATKFCLGVWIGTLTLFTIGTILTSYLFYLIPIIEPVMVYIGSGYILWLAYKTYRDKPGEKGDDGDEKASTSTIRTGILICLVNVKLMLYILTSLSTFILPFFHGFKELAPFVIILGSIVFPATFTWALFGAMFQKFYDAHKKPVNIVLALTLVYCALSVLPIFH